MKKWCLILGVFLWVGMLFAQDPLDPYSNWTPNPGKRTIVTGEIKNPQNSTFFLSVFRNLLAFDRQEFVLELDDKNRFTFEFFLKVPTEATLSNGKGKSRLYLEPGDSLYFYFDAQQFPKAIYVGGQGSSHNKFLFQFESIFSSFDINSTFQRFVNQAPGQFKRFITKEWERRMTFYRDFSSTENVSFSKAFHGYIQADINYWRALNLLLFRHEYNIIGGKTSDQKLPLSYFQFLKDILINNDYAIYNPNYASFLDQYLKLILENPQIEPEFVLTPTESDAIILSNPDNGFVLEEIPRGIPLKYLLIRSSVASRFLVNGKYVNGYWYKVATPLGNEGWIQGIGLSFDTTFQQPPLEETSIATISNTYVHGSARNYVKAYDLFWRMAISIPGDYSREVKQYLDGSAMDYLNDNILSAYRERELGNDIIKSYSILTPFNQENTDFDIINEDQKNEWFASTEKEISDEFTFKGGTIIKEQKTAGSKKKTSLLSLELQKKNPKVWKDLRWENTTIPSVVSLRGAVPKKFKSPVLRLHSDPISLGLKEYILEVTPEKGIFQRIVINNSKSGKLEINNEEYPILLIPGYDLAFNVTPEGAISYVGKGAKINNYFVAKTKQFKALDQKVKKAIEGRQPAEFKQLLDKVRMAKLKFLKNFQLQYQLSIEAFEYAKGEINYWYGYELLNYPYEHPLYHGLASPISVPANYYDGLQTILISQPNALPNPYYTYFLDQFFELEKQKRHIHSVDDELFLKEYLRGKSYYFYRAKQLSNYCKRGKGLEKGKEIQYFLDECPYGQYSEVLYQTYQANRGFNAGDRAPVFQLEDLNGQLVSTDEFAGKVVYLDFWATWCQPCIFELTNSGGWKNEFFDDDVVFVYVSLDRDERAWKKFLRENDIPGEHLIVSSSRGFQDAVPKSYKVKRLPAKFVIDPDGNIAFYPELKSSGVKIKELIRQLVKS